METPTILDCGHQLPTLPAGHTGGSGYAILEAGRKVCYTCAGEYQRARMVETGSAVLYLVSAPGANAPAEVTDWPGGLRFPVTGWRRSARGGGFGSQRTDAWFNGPDGYVWHAINRGDMDLARCKRTREKVRA